MRDKIHNPKAKFIVAKWSSGLILSEWEDIEGARTHRDAVCVSYKAFVDAPCPYAIYTRAEWEQGFKAFTPPVDTGYMLMCAEGAAD